MSVRTSSDFVRSASSQKEKELTGERARSLLLQAPVASAMLVGPRHVFELATPLYCELAGRDELVGKEFLDVFPELAGSDLASRMDEAYRSGEPFAVQEMPATVRRNGRPEDCFFRFNGAPLRHRSGAICGLIIVAMEVTELARTRQTLEQANAERQALLTQLEAASRAKDEFLAMLGHELRNPLSPIVTALELMKLRGGPATVREQAIIQRQVDHLVRLVDDLLDVAKMTRGEVELRKQWVQVSEVLDKAIEQASHLLEYQAHTLSLDVPQHLAWRGDPVRLAQVVANLLTNAARYTPRGGRIELRGWADRGDVVISVKDNGMGIPADILPHVFDLFFQGHRTVERSGGGMGIGLALVHNLVSLHGGTVEANSAGPGQGSEFVIRLPISDPGDEDSERLPPLPAAGMVAPKRILMVDDNRDAAETLADILRLDGHIVLVASDPLAGLALAARLSPHIAILDIGLPGMDGYELAARLRETFSAEACRLIALTGYGQERDRQRSRDAGFDAHLVKPVDVNALINLITTL